LAPDRPDSPAGGHGGRCGSAAHDVDSRRQTLRDAAHRGALAWVAYPKAGQLGTDLNRDRVRDELQTSALDTVRQIAVNDVWSALRLRSTDD